jgi:hypothetical protein
MGLLLLLASPYLVWLVLATVIWGLLRRKRMHVTVRTFLQALIFTPWVLVDRHSFLVIPAFASLLALAPPPGYYSIGFHLYGIALIFVAWLVLALISSYSQKRHNRATS